MPRTLKLAVSRLCERCEITYLCVCNVCEMNGIREIITGEECVEKPLSLIWKTYCSKHRSNLAMKLTVTRSGLKVS